jgi:Zn-dependent peptidase ImmA (M78 family)
MKNLLKTLQRDYPALTFRSAGEFCWSPKTGEILYKGEGTSHTAAWSLLHELGHALLDHRSYQSDLELLQLETAAWQKAREVGKQYGYEIDENHIEDCLDT